MFQGGSLWTGLIAGGIYQLGDTKAYQNGEIKKNDYAIKTASNVTSAVGVMAGVEYGALWGSALLPGIGTVAGGIVGGILGNQLGQYVGGQAGNAIFGNRLNFLFQNPNAGQQSQTQAPVH
jgi:outer membrane lipoprotein SlyB